MSKYRSHQRASAVAKTRTLPNLHIIASVYFLSTGLLALVFALGRI